MRALANRCRLAPVVLCVALVVLAASPAASAAPPSGAAQQQYVENLPGAGGATSPPPGSPSSSAAQQYVEVVPGAGGSSALGSLGEAPTPAGSSPLTAAVSAIASGDERHVLGLGVAMFIVTLSLLAAAGLRIRRRDGGR